MPAYLSEELRALVVASAHRVQPARDIASKYLNRLITSFPSLMCDPKLVYTLLEALTLLQRACNNEFMDEQSAWIAYTTCLGGNQVSGLTLRRTRWSDVCW